MVFLMAFLTILHKKGLKQKLCNFQVVILDTILEFLLLSAVQIPNELHFLLYLMNNDHMHRKMHFQTIQFKSNTENLYLADILDVILNFSKHSMMTECHHPESWMTMSVLE